MLNNGCGPGRFDAQMKRAHTRQVTRCRKGAVAAVVIAGTVAASAVAANSAGPTYMFIGQKNIGYIMPEAPIPERPDLPSRFYVYCDAYEGAEVRRRKQRVEVRSALFDLMAYGHQISANRWTLFRHREGSPSPRATAIRRTPNRWDLWRGKRKLGHTVGPDGLEAAAALLSPCGF